jgi:acetyl-CoA synthetase
MYRRSIADPVGFWRDETARLDWIRPWTELGHCSFAEEDFGIEWFPDGMLNVSANCIDRHLATRGEQAAIIWEGDTPDRQRRLSYRELHREVCRAANALKRLGVERGDRVTIYLPMIPEAAIAMLACARIGAIHSVVFGGFSADALGRRINDCESKVVITADGGMRAGKLIPLKANVDAAAEGCPSIRSTLVVRHASNDVRMQGGRDHWWHEALSEAASDCPVEAMNAEDALFILYTSGSTGTPKGVVHSTGGYLAWAAMTHQYVFDYRPDDIYWCAADVGWITGHTYGVYGPLANGATTVMFEGVPSYPTHSRFWEIVDRYRVSIFYGAPTALRALMREGDEWVKASSRRSLRVLGSVGEPINPEAWDWYWRVVGEERCPIVDTWWQTETGGAMIAPLPGASTPKPGSASMPLFGVVPQIVDADGRVIDGVAEGHLCIDRSWPGQMRGVWDDRRRFFETYFTTYPGRYFTGDGCRRDADGDFWITGRVDDVINVSGHRLGTAEIESALVAHRMVAEAAVVGVPHEIKGQGIYAYVTLNAGEQLGERLRSELIAWVRQEIGPIATPDTIHFASALPKTRSGKIMRRILRKIAEGDVTALGDTSTLADPGVIGELVGGGR